MTIQQLPSLSSAGLYNACEGSLYYISPMGAENLCINPSFEYDTAGWTSTGLISRVSNGYSQHFALQAILTANQSVSYALPTNPTTTSYAASIYIYHTNTTSVNVIFQAVDSITLASRRYTIAPNQWHRIQISFIGRNNATTIQVIAQSSCTIKLDACQIEVSTVGATTYFDGDTLGTQLDSQVIYQQYGWIGGQHASVSYRNRQTTNGGVIIDLQQYGFQLISISGAGNPNFDNQILTFASTDGGVLQDVVVGPRDISMLGRISASTKIELHQRMQTFMAIFQRDQVAYYQPRSWKFQHKSGKDLVGQEISFSGVLVSAVAGNVTDQLSVDVNIQIKMIDPYFYGHDVSVEASDALFYGQSSSPIVFDWIDSYQVSNTVSNATQGRFVFNNTVNDMVTYNGRCYIVGAFTQITDTVTATVYNHSYMTIFDSRTNTFIAPPSTINAQVLTIDISPNGKYIVIGGDFTTIGAITCNRIAIYTIATNTLNRIHPTYIGVDNSVRSVRFGKLIKGSLWDYTIYLGGTFLNGNVVGALNRVASFTNVMNALGTGVNSDVNAVCADEIANYLYIGGAFTASVSGVNMRRIGAFSLSAGGTYTGFNFGLDGDVSNIVLKQSSQIYISGSYSNFLNNASGAVISSCAKLLKGNSLTLSNIAVPLISQDFIWPSNPSITNLRVYQDGVTYARSYVGSTTVYTYYYNENNGITTMFPVAGSRVRYHDTQLNRTYYIISNGANRATPKPVALSVDSTARSGLFARIRLLSQYESTIFADNTISVFAGIQNISNGLYIYTSIPTSVSNTLADIVTSKMIPWVNFGDVIIFDTRVGQITSQFTALLEDLNPTSSLYSLSVMPGTNLIQVYLLQGFESLITANPEVVVGYTQTYQSIFDGINRI
jgi:hypothetical protein